MVIVDLHHARATGQGNRSAAMLYFVAALGGFPSHHDNCSQPASCMEIRQVATCAGFGYSRECVSSPDYATFSVGQSLLISLCLVEDAGVDYHIWGHQGSPAHLIPSSGVIRGQLLNGQPCG